MFLLAEVEHSGLFGMFENNLINWLILVGFLGWVLGKNLPPAFKGREESINATLNQAKKAKEEAEALLEKQKAAVANAEKEGYELAYLTDLRFANEYEVLKSNGFIMIRINAEEELRRGRANCWMELSDMSEKDRLTETELDNHNFDIVIENNKSINHFYNEIHRLLDKRYCLT